MALQFARSVAAKATTTSSSSFTPSITSIASRSFLLSSSSSSSLLSRNFLTRTLPLRSDFDPNSSFTSSSDSSDSSSTPSSSSSPSYSSRSSSFQRPYVYGQFKIHKLKSALSISFSRPVITRFRPDTTSNQWSLKKPGSLRMDFAASRASSTNGDSAAASPHAPTSFDWKNKLQLQLNVLEIGTLLAFSSNPQATEAKFYHDPNMGTNEAGTVTKELKIQRNGVGRGYFFNLTQTDANRHRTALSVPVSDSEFAILVVLCQNALPQLLCMQTVEPQRAEVVTDTK